MKQVQSDFLAEFPVHAAGQDRDHQLRRGADGGPVQMPAHDPALAVSGAHVQVAVERSLHGVDGAGEGDDLVAALEAVGVIGFARSVKDAHGEVVHRAQALDRGQTDLLPQGQDPELLRNVLAGVQADDAHRFKSLVFHGMSSLFCAVTGYPARPESR